MADDPEHFLWVNDDTLLDDTAVELLLETERAISLRTGAPTIVAGSTRDPKTGNPTYGGVQRPSPWLRPLRFELVRPTEEPQACETMHGNCVLIPRGVVEAVGVLDPTFTHAMGDFDYGLRARRSGFAVWITPRTVGTCARNPKVVHPTLRDEVHALLGPKGLPPRDWFVFSRRWGGPLWPVFAASPYARSLLRRVGAKRPPRPVKCE